MEYRLRGGNHITREKRLDRIAQFDDRSRTYQVRPLLAASPTRRRRTIVVGPGHDQGQEGACFPPGTFVRMADGSQKAIEDVRTLSTVVTAEGRVGLVTATMVRPSSELISVKLRGHAVMDCTPEHPLLTKRGYVAARDLTRDDVVAVTRFSLTTDDPIEVNSLVDTKRMRGTISGQVNQGGVASEIAVLPQLLGRSPSFGRLVGLYAAEGCVTPNKVVWSYGGHERDTLVQETIDLLKSVFEAKARLQERPNGSLNVVLYGKTWMQLFAALVPGTSKHGDKHLSGYVTQGPPSFLQAVLTGWLDGDGHRRRNEVTGVTVSKRLALDMHAIAGGLGLRPVLATTKPTMNKYAKTRQDRWTVEIPEGGGTNVQQQDDRAVWRRVVSTELKPFNGWVFNLSVEGDESYVADGLGVHNCTGFGAVHAAQAKPHSKGIMNAQISREWYFDNQHIDEWEGGSYPGADPVYEGSSVLATMKTGVARGMWSSYYWVGAGSQTPMKDAVETMRYVGPVVFGLPWYESMFDPDSAGVIKIDLDSELMGGHCIAGQDALWMKPSADHAYGLYIVLQNSWGASYGTSYKGFPGFVFAKADDNFEALLYQDGEGAVPIR